MQGLLRREFVEASLRTRLLTMHFTLGLAGLLAALITGKPTLIALAAPFLLSVFGSLAVFRRLDATATVRFAADRVTEGDVVDLIVEVTSVSGMPRADVEVELADRLSTTGRLRRTTSVAPGSTSTFVFPLEATEWGVATVGHVTLRVSDRLGMFAHTILLKSDDTVRIGLPDDRRRVALEADRFRRIAGSHTSNDRGDGVELADVRKYQPGDALKNINWRITQRRGEPWINLRHPDRSSTVILVVDAHARVHTSLQEIQRQSVAAALSLVQAQLNLHDRVGLLIVGHTTKWLEPRVGRRQLFRISDALIAVGNTPDASLRLYRPRVAARVPSNAIVLAVSPLLDPLMVRLLAQLRSSGNPVSVLRPRIGTVNDRLPRRERLGTQSRALAALEQQIGVQSLRERGVAIAEWEPDQPLDQALQAITIMRRSEARAHAW